MLAVGMAAHAPLLRMLAEAMTVDDPLPTAAWVFVLRGDYRFDRAAALYEAGGASGVLFIDPPPTRLVRCGVLSPKKEEFLREFGRRGIPRKSVIALPGNDRTPWQIAHSLESWLVENPDSQVLVLCERFTARDLRFVVWKLMQPNDARRVAFRALPDHRYDESNWWHNRAGVRALVGATCDLIYDFLRGEDAPNTSRFDPDEYERELRAVP